MTDFFSRAILLLIFIIFWSCQDNGSKNGDIINFVPENVSIVLKFSEEPDLQTSFKEFQGHIKNNSLLSAFSKKKAFSNLLKKATILKHLSPESTSLLCFNQDNDSLAVFYVHNES